MQMTIAIRKEVDDEVEAKTILAAIDTVLKPFGEDDLDIKTSLTVDIELPPPTP